MSMIFNIIMKYNKYDTPKTHIWLFFQHLSSTKLSNISNIISYIDYDFIKFENQSHPTFINQTEEQSMK